MLEAEYCHQVVIHRVHTAQSGFIVIHHGDAGFTANILLYLALHANPGTLMHTTDFYFAIGFHLAVHIFLIVRDDVQLAFKLAHSAKGADMGLFGKCPYVTAQKVLTGKWSMYIMYLLSDGPVRFNELQRRMPEEMTHTTLSRQLKALEDEGLIVRKEYQQIPPKVEYSLSEIGEKFKRVLSVLEVWGNEYIQYLQHKN